MISTIRQFGKISKNISRFLCTTNINYDNHSCKFLIIGGGTAGCAMASKITNDFGSDKVIILEPNDLHYYQPLFTLIGGGVKPLKSSYRNMEDVLPKKAKWIKDSVETFKPHNNEILSKSGDTINYEYLIISTGLQLNYDAVSLLVREQLPTGQFPQDKYIKCVMFTEYRSCGQLSCGQLSGHRIPGLEEALNDIDSSVCSIYSPKYVTKAWKRIETFKGGDAIFTYPNTPIKCPGAPQKIMYLAENHFRNRNIRDKVNITYNSSLNFIFSVKKYADALWKVVEHRNINVNLRRNLIAVDNGKKEAVFQNLDNLEEKFIVNYDLLHVTPPMGPSKALLNAPSLTNAAGFITVNQSTLQHSKFQNIFALGDCTDTTNAKTAAAVASQSSILFHNLKNFIDNKPLDASYIGYTSCPLVTSYNTCILAEFDYKFEPLETFAFNQGKERKSMYHVKKDILPVLYWNLMTKGYWNGPKFMRSIFNPLKSN